MNQILRNTLIAATITSILVGCGGEDSTSDDGLSSVSSNDAETVMVDIVVPDETDAEPEQNVVVQSGLLGPPQYIQGECGSANVSDVVANNSTATPMFVDQVVAGQLLPDSTVLDSDLYEIELDVGNYHLITDISSVTGNFETLNLDISNVTADGDERLAFHIDSAIDTRGYTFLEIQSPRTMVIRVEPGSEPVNYEMGIFANGSSVPTPRFSTCAPTTRFSLGETQTGQTDGLLTSDDFRFYQINLPAGFYNLDATTTSVETSTISHEFVLFQRFADTDAESRIGFDVDNGTSLSSSFMFSTLDDAEVWIRVSPSRGQSRGTFDFEFTVTGQ